MSRPALPRRERIIAAAASGVYLLALLLIAFWPEHVDQGASAFLEALERMLPWATHENVEFASNILLFVPFGMLGAAIARRAPGLVLAAGFAVSGLVELAQAVLLPGRTASFLDVFANTAGTAIGVGLMLIVHRVRDRPAPPPSPPDLPRWDER